MHLKLQPRRHAWTCLAVVIIDTSKKLQFVACLAERSHRSLRSSPLFDQEFAVLKFTSILAIGFACSLVAASVTRAESIEPKYFSNLRQVTSGFVKAGEGYFSPDGRTIIYQAVPQGYPFYQIYTQPLAGGEPKRISTGRGRTTCSYFSPDGKKILFASSHTDPNMTATEDAERKQQEEDRKAGVRRRYKWD